MSWCVLHSHSHYSLNDAIAKPSKMAKRCAELGYPAVAITDHGNLGCAVDFVTEMDKVGIKPILGCEFNLCDQDSTVHAADNDKPYSHAIVLAKNAAGWRQLVAAVSRSASREHAFHGPRLDLEQFRDFTQGRDLVAVTGHIGSDVANAVFTMPRNAYASLSRRTIWEEYFDRADYEKKVVSLLERYISIFGKENVFLEAQVMKPSLHPATLMVANVLRQVGPKLGLPIVATADVHYVSEGDAPDHRVVLRSAMKTSVRKQATAILRHKDYTIETFFKGSGCHHLPTTEEVRRHHTDEEIENTALVADMCEKYSIITQPRLPHFPCPDGMEPEGYLRELCERGWRGKVEGNDLPYPVQTYRDRLEMELGVINGAGLPSYFLIVQDFMNYGHEHNWMIGPGRGSSAGCIVSWLIGVTAIDPVRYGLIFERFYNAGRNAPGRVSLPDIDSDVPKYKREEVYRYLQKKYGEDRVAKIATFPSMQGRSAITAVMSANDVPFDLVKRITRAVPDKARITEELEEMRQRGEEPSIISYALDVYKDDLAEWVQEQDDGLLTGEYAQFFSQARRLEGVKTHIGIHAAGVAIGAEPLAGVCPLKYDASEQAYIAALEWEKLEQIGVPKFDVLATAFLDKGMCVRSLVRRGRIYDDTIPA
jgi:DNA polymerase III subunit alpha